MLSTERLYYKDSYLFEFAAIVLDVRGIDSNHAAVVLDRTAFYPTGGGQPHDTGFLNDARVVDCTEENDAVLHIVESASLETGSHVTGRIDRERRLDHIQQHTGQHILSQAFVKLFNAQTRSFRMMAASSEIDVELDSSSEKLVQEAVRVSNEIIWENRAVKVRYVTKEEAVSLSLRKDTAREGELRIIEIEGFDLTPCGGTHARQTGEVGMIAARSWERAKGMTRIEFTAGRRTLEDYINANAAAREIAAKFSVGRDDAPKSVQRLLEENKQLLRRAHNLEQSVAEDEALKLVAAAPVTPAGDRLVVQIVKERDQDSLRILASAIALQSRAIALLGSEDGESARLVFAKNKDASGNMNALMKEACRILGGRGGGNSNLAQGGGPSTGKLSEAVKTAAALVLTD